MWLWQCPGLSRFSRKLEMKSVQKQQNNRQDILISFQKQQNNCQDILTNFQKQQNNCQRYVQVYKFSKPENKGAKNKDTKMCYSTKVYLGNLSRKEGHKKACPRDKPPSDPPGLSFWYMLTPGDFAYFIPHFKRDQTTSNTTSWIEDISFAQCNTY